MLRLPKLRQGKIILYYWLMAGMFMLWVITKVDNWV